MLREKGIPVVFCYLGISHLWTLLQVRPSRHDTVGGVPDESGAFDCSAPVSKDKILGMESKCAYKEEEENVFQEYFHHVMERRGASVSVKPWRRTLFMISTHKYCAIILKLFIMINKRLRKIYNIFFLYYWQYS